MRRRRVRRTDEVELNLAAMLDMAFQILAFFILTFDPSPIEGQVSLHMPPPRPVTKIDATADPGDDTNNKDPLAGLNTLVITVLADNNGDLGEMAIGDVRVSGLSALESRLKQLFSDTGTGFDQVLLQVHSNLRYQALMDVVDVCTQQKGPDGQLISKLGFVELPSTTGTEEQP